MANYMCTVCNTKSDRNKRPGRTSGCDCHSRMKNSLHSLHSFLETADSNGDDWRRRVAKVTVIGISHYY